MSVHLLHESFTMIYKWRETLLFYFDKLHMKSECSISLIKYLMFEFFDKFIHRLDTWVPLAPEMSPKIGQCISDGAERNYYRQCFIWTGPDCGICQQIIVYHKGGGFGASG